MLVLVLVLVVGQWNEQSERIKRIHKTGLKMGQTKGVARRGRQR